MNIKISWIGYSKCVPGNAQMFFLQFLRPDLSYSTVTVALVRRIIEMQNLLTPKPNEDRKRLRFCYHHFRFRCTTWHPTWPTQTATGSRHRRPSWRQLNATMRETSELCSFSMVCKVFVLRNKNKRLTETDGRMFTIHVATFDFRKQSTMPHCICISLNIILRTNNHRKYNLIQFIRWQDYSYHGPLVIVPSVDFSYTGRLVTFVPSLYHMTWHSYRGLFLPSLDLLYHVRQQRYE